MKTLISLIVFCSINLQAAQLLTEAIFSGDIKEVKKLIQNKKQANQTFSEQKHTPLILAAISEQTEIASHLIKTGADVTIKDRDGLSALNHAGNNGADDIALSILQTKKLKVNQSEVWSFIKGNCVKALEWTVKNQPKTKNFLDSDGNSVLHIAAKIGAVEIIKFYLANKVDKRIRNNQGKTALDIAREVKNTDVAKLLL